MLDLPKCFKKVPQTISATLIYKKNIKEKHDFSLNKNTYFIMNSHMHFIRRKGANYLSELPYLTQWGL